MKVRSCRPAPAANVEELAHDGVEALLRVADEVHLVHADGDLRHAEQPGERGVAARLLGQPAAGVDEDHGQVGGRGARDHVARVLRVAGAVVRARTAPRRREVAVGDVDRDALLALGAQAVGQVREVLEAGLLVGHQGLGVEQQAADQRRLAVVDGARPWRRASIRSTRPLAVLHGGLGHAVVGARLAALGDARRGDLGHDVVERGGARRDGAGAAHVADGAVAHRLA